MIFSRKNQAPVPRQQIIVRTVTDRYNDQLVNEFDPARLKALKDSIATGQLDQIESLYRTMMSDWDALRKDVNDVAKAVASVTWDVVPWTEPGSAPTPEAQEVADTVYRALWKGTRTAPGKWEHIFADLLEAVVHGIYRGQTVHEIIWQGDGELVYPAHYLPVTAQFFAWAMRGDDPDELRLFRDGIGTGAGEPFPANKFIVGLNKSGIDHPIYNAELRSLVGWFGAYKWGLPWLMQYCQIFGIPFRNFIVNDDEEKAQLERELAETGASTYMVSMNGARMETSDAMHGGGSIPQEVLINLANKACDRLILGQTLTSDTSKDGGSYSLGKVHQGIRVEVIAHAAQYVANILNAQLVPAIVALNYGHDAPTPELQFTIPGSEADRDKLAYIKEAVIDLGLPLSEQYVYEFLGKPKPAEGDPVFRPAQYGAAGREVDPVSAAARERYPKG